MIMITLKQLSDIVIKYKNNLNKLIVLFLTKENMLDYGRPNGMTGAYGNDFAAMPKVVSGKPKYKDPYGGNAE
jgi:hypothetical protein